MTDKEFLQCLKNMIVNELAFENDCNWMVRLQKIIDNYDKIERLQSLLNGDYS